MRSIFGEDNQQFQYSAALTAVKPKVVGVLESKTVLEVFTAHSDDEATSIAFRFAYIRFPREEGYRDHYVTVAKTESLTDSMAEINNARGRYTRCICGTLLHYHKGTTCDTRKTKLETAVYNLQFEGYTKKEILSVAELYFPSEP